MKAGGQMRGGRLFAMLVSIEKNLEQNLLIQ